MSEIDDLVDISKYAGERFDLVQAGGGNSSVKYDNGEEFDDSTSGNGIWEPWEDFQDGNGEYDIEEDFQDGNDVYDFGEVFIDSELFDGALTIGECFIQGKSEKEILLSTICATRLWQIMNFQVLLHSLI